MPEQNSPAPLSFESEPGSGRSKWVAAVLSVAIIGWMGSGYLLPSEPQDQARTEPVGQRIVTVAVRASRAETVQQYFLAEGQAEPQRDTMILSKTGGEVSEIFVERGADLEAGQEIARIAPADRRADLKRAREQLAQAQREYENARTLLDRGVTTVDRLAQARTALATAEAQVASAEEAIADTAISAPFAGRLEVLSINVGEYVGAGVAVARVVDLTPLTVQVRVPQQSQSEVDEGQTAQVSFITGQTREGTVTFVGTSADAETRTFEAEIEVPNDDLAIPAGVSAQVRIPTSQARAHFLSPAVLSLDVSGKLGVKTVNDDETVAFHAVEIIRAQTDGVWVTGLPDEARIITVGQGFVNAGETVEARPESEFEIDRVRDGAAPADTATALGAASAAESDPGAVPATGDAAATEPGE